MVEARSQQTCQYLAGASISSGLSAQRSVRQAHVLDDLRELEVYLQQQVLTPPAHHTAKDVKILHFLTISLTTLELPVPVTGLVNRNAPSSVYLLLFRDQFEFMNKYSTDPWERGWSAFLIWHNQVAFPTVIKFCSCCWLALGKIQIS